MFMAVLEIRQRTGWLFVGVVFAHVILISAQAKTGRGVPVLESVVFGLFAEVERGTNTAVGGARSTWQDYFALQEIREQNERLSRDVANLKIELQREQTMAGQARSLQQLLDLRNELPVATIAARVIGGGASPDFKTITIDKGTQDGVAPDMAVIAPQGVVGRVIQPSSRAAKVQLLIDSDSAAGAIIDRSRAQGVAVGVTSGLRLAHVAASADIQVGDRLVTSGIDGIFPASPPIDGRYPRGFAIGHIESVERGAGGFKSIVVRPAVDFTSLETVLVVTTRPSAEALEAAASPRGNGNEAR